MGELDVEALKARWDACLRLVDAPASRDRKAQTPEYYRAQTALFEEFIDQAPEVLAALERAERLEAALRELDEIGTDGLEPGTPLWIALMSIEDALAPTPAEEGR